MTISNEYQINNSKAKEAKIQRRKNNLSRQKMKNEIDQNEKNDDE